MAIGAFPLAKLGALLLKQISKPLANVVKNRAKTHPTFRTYICMPPAQFYNWCEVKYKMWLLNLGKPVDVPKLNENQAIELGANILGEGIIFAIAALILILEYRRQVAKETAKESKRIEEFDKLVSTINDVYFDSQKNQAEIRELTRHVHYLETELRKFPPPPPKGDNPPIKDKILEDIPKEPLPPTNISYKHVSDQIEPVFPIKTGSILSAISYLENEIISPDNSDRYIEQETSSLVMGALEYLDSDVFRNNQENDVIIILKNAPYASHAYY